MTLMAGMTIDTLKETTARLRKKLADKGESLDGTGTRVLKKRIRRAQRRRRKMEAAVARATKKAASAKSEST